jgi:hypothetical protein
MVAYGADFAMNWVGLAWLAGVSMEMVWPLDEGAAVPLCAPTVDQGAPDGGCAGLIMAPVVQRPLHVCAVW